MFIPKYVRWYGEPGDPPPPSPLPPPPPPPPPPAPVMLTQEQANNLIAKERRETTAKMQKEIDALKASGSGGNTEQLQATINQLNNSLLSETERAKKEADEIKKGYEGKVTAEQQRADKATKLFNDTLIHLEIAKAAATHIAFDETGEQLSTLLAHKAKVVETMAADGKPTGVFRVMIASKTAEGKDVDVEVDTAVANLRADRKYGNYFKVDKTPGTGTLNTIPGTGDPNMTVPTNMSEFMSKLAELRNQGKA